MESCQPSRSIVTNLQVLTMVNQFSVIDIVGLMSFHTSFGLMLPTIGLFSGAIIIVKFSA